MMILMIINILKQVSIQYQIKSHSNVLIPELGIFDASHKMFKRTLEK